MYLVRRFVVLLVRKTVNIHQWYITKRIRVLGLQHIVFPWPSFES